MEVFETIGYVIGTAIANVIEHIVLYFFGYLMYRLLKKTLTPMRQEFAAVREEFATEIQRLEDRFDSFLAGRSPVVRGAG